MKRKLWFIAALLTIFAALGLAQVVETGGSLRLNWDDNPESDLSHYNVYRSDSFGGPYALVNATTETLVVAWKEVDGVAVENGSIDVAYTAHVVGRLTASEFIDGGLTEGGVFWYRVTAVDTSWNESDPSGRAGRLLLGVGAPWAPKGLR